MGATARMAVALLAATAVFSLAACTENSPPPDPRASRPAPAPSIVETTPPAAEPDPELVPGGTAEENLAYFDWLNEAMLENGNPGGRPLIDNLVSAGFDKSAMQVTADRTPLGNRVDTLVFSVQIGDECLIGQAGGGEYTSVVAPALKSGGCLIGDTHSIDW